MYLSSSGFAKTSGAESEIPGSPQTCVRTQRANGAFCPRQGSAARVVDVERAVRVSGEQLKSKFSMRHLDETYIEFGNRTNPRPVSWVCSQPPGHWQVGLHWQIQHMVENARSDRSCEVFSQFRLLSGISFLVDLTVLPVPRFWNFFGSNELRRQEIIEWE